MTTEKERRPTHLIWQVVGEGKPARWIRVGAAWENRDGKGLSLRFDSYPVVGRTVIRLNEQEDEAPEQSDLPDRAEQRPLI